MSVAEGNPEPSKGSKSKMQQVEIKKNIGCHQTLEKNTFEGQTTTQSGTLYNKSSWYSLNCMETCRDN